MRHPNIDSATRLGTGVFGNLQDIAILRQAPALDFLLQLLHNILIILQPIHIVMRKQKLSPQVTIDIEHGDTNS